MPGLEGFCRLCADEIKPPMRAEIADTCLACGERLAQKEAERRKKCVAPQYNKGAYQYITSEEVIKDAHRKGGNKL